MNRADLRDGISCLSLTRTKYVRVGASEGHGRCSAISVQSRIALIRVLVAKPVTRGGEERVGGKGIICPSRDRIHSGVDDRTRKNSSVLMQLM
jgi:hypothetical protein